MTHPAQFSPEVLDALAPHLRRYGLAVHDPFAGAGVRLGALCDRLSLPFSGTDIEAWPDADPRVTLGDSTDPATYPTGDGWLVATSPTYANRMADYANGPLSTTNPKGRRAYGMALGRALHANNSGRFGPRRLDEYVGLHERIVQLWPRVALVNVSDCIAGGERVCVVGAWLDLLHRQGYEWQACERVSTRRYRMGANAEARIDGERLIVAERTAP